MALRVDQRLLLDGDLFLQRSADGTVALYDLATDPTEQVDLSGAGPADVAALVVVLDASSPGRPGPSHAVDPALGRELTRLRYFEPE